MAKQTSPMLEQKIMYSVFVRNHSKPGTFQEVTKDLERIRSLGTDIVWLMPIYPTGIECRKGSAGSPYAIRDYRAIDPALGNWDDLKQLVDQAHKLGMKVIVDIVFNHTSPDSVLFKAHPEWFYTNAQGKPASLVEEWSDIIDLDFSHPELQTYLIDTLKMYAGILDGFRCDVATRVPVSFWLKAREACAKVNPDLIWLAESCHLPFTKFIRDHGRVGECDADLYQAFDVLYDYDAYPYAEKIFKEHKPMAEWVDALIRQDAALPSGAIKLRYLENHDNDRIAKYVTDPVLWKNWTALQFCLKGLPLVYHGQEQKESHRPSIFDPDPIAWKKDDEATGWITAMAKIHKEQFQPNSAIEYQPDDDQHMLGVMRDGKTGFFLLDEPISNLVAVSLPDGTYHNLFTNQNVTIQDGKLSKDVFPLLVDGQYLNKQIF